MISVAMFVAIIIVPKSSKRALESLKVIPHKETRASLCAVLPLYYPDKKNGRGTIISAEEKQKCEYTDNVGIGAGAVAAKDVYNEPYFFDKRLTCKLQRSKSQPGRKAMPRVIFPRISGSF